MDTSDQTKDIYELRGVSSQKEDVHKALTGIDKGLYPNAFCKILPDYWSSDTNTCCIMHSDTAGTKPIIAHLYHQESPNLQYFAGLTQDALTMNLDDMACCGMIGPFIASGIISRNKTFINGDIIKVIIQSAEEFAEKMRSWGIELYLAGGETADVGDLVQTLDVGYTIAGRMFRADVIEIKPQAGDFIIGFSSGGKDYFNNGNLNSGIGCNGLTSARHDLLNKFYATHHPESYNPNLPENVIYLGNHRLSDFNTQLQSTIGEALLSPTLPYAPLIKKIITYIGKSALRYIHGILHLTGGGHTKRLKFGHQVEYIIDTPLPILPIFRLIQSAAPTEWEQLYSTFNMGARLDIYTPDFKLANDIIAISKEIGIESQIIGRIELYAPDNKQYSKKLTVQYPENTATYYS